jgi:exonuclease III
MKIATWNVERLKHKKSLNRIIQMCEEIQADILVLTETDEQVSPSYKYCMQTSAA